MFDELRELSQSFIKFKFEPFRRYFISTTPLKHRFAIILGERGIGKTTATYPVSPGCGQWQSIK